MAREAFGRVKLEVEITERNTALGSGSAVAAMVHRALIDLTITSGTQDGQADRAHSDALALTTTPTDVDLAGVLASEIGAGTTTFVEVSGLLIRNTSDVGDIVVGGDANAFALFGATTHTLSVKPGGFVFLSAPKGYTVTAGTGDILQLAASAGTVNCEYIVFGRSA